MIDVKREELLDGKLRLILPGPVEIVLTAIEDGRSGNPTTTEIPAGQVWEIVLTPKDMPTIQFVTPPPTWVSITSRWLDAWHDVVFEQTTGEFGDRIRFMKEADGWAIDVQDVDGLPLRVKAFLIPLLQKAGIGVG